jgi:hypothetical protein
METNMFQTTNQYIINSWMLVFLNGHSSCRPISDEGQIDVARAFFVFGTKFCVSLGCQIVIDIIS